MRLHELKPVPGSRHRQKRVGRGPGSGHGKTCCRGHKGQRARSGANIKPNFEGGQTPLYKRVPKRGFNPLPKQHYVVFNLSALSGFEGEVNPQELKKSGLLDTGNERIKILGEGNLEKPLRIKANSFSVHAREKIEKAGGKAEVI